MNEALSKRSIILPFCLTIITVRITTLPPNSYVTLGKSLAILGLLICKQGSSSLPCCESGKGLVLNQHLASDPLFPPIKWVPFLGPHHSHAQLSGSVEGCCAHNPEVDGWKPSSASCLSSQVALVFKKKKKNACQSRCPKEMWVLSLSGEDPLEEGMATHSTVLD